MAGGCGSKEEVPLIDAEDAHIMAWVRQEGRKWTRPLEEGQWEGAQTKLSLRHRFLVLDDLERNELLSRHAELATDAEGLADIPSEPTPNIDEDRPDEERVWKVTGLPPAGFRALLRLPALNSFCSETWRWRHGDGSHPGAQWRLTSADGKAAGTLASIPLLAPSNPKSRRRRKR
jgi:hypothetical protein